MSFPSFMKRMPGDRLFSGNWPEDMAKSEMCTKCGECEARCPYNLPIRDMLVERREMWKAATSKYLAETQR